MENAKYKYRIAFDFVPDPIVPVLKDSDIFGAALISITRLWKHQECLCAIVNTVYDTFSRSWIFGTDVFEDVLQPALRFFRPD
tara:strand:- start:750 stop:998 length:249 start_codon:yes stop_codon:yes gene_type:complete